MFRRYYPHFVEISTSRGYYPHFVDIIYIDHITSYLARNVRPIFHIYLFSESDWCKRVKFFKGFIMIIYKLSARSHKINTYLPGCCVYISISHFNLLLDFVLFGGSQTNGLSMTQFMSTISILSLIPFLPK